jgi:hypothetical protein
MRKFPFLRLDRIEDFFFEEPTPSYSLLALLAMMLGAGIVYGTGRAPGMATHLAMLATALGTSRIFNSGLLKQVWLVTVGLIGFLLLLDISSIS